MSASLATEAENPPFVFTEEHKTMRESVRRLMHDWSSDQDVRRTMETDIGYDRVLWSKIAEVGLLGLLVPKRFGGEECSLLELVIVLEEMGRALLCGPYFATVALATNALLVSEDEDAQRRFLPAIATGEMIATVALPARSSRGDDLDVSATLSPDGYRLTGTARFVPDGHAADLILVSAQTEAGPSLFAVDGSSLGLTRRPLATLDLTRKQADLTFVGVPGWRVGREGEADRLVEAALDQARIALAAEQLGGMQIALDSAVAYAKVRLQFGRPIGSFQAIKHKCADMLLIVESARSAVYHAAWTAARGSPEVCIAACVAQICCSDGFLHVARESIHIHGGIGFTWDHPAHLYFRRAHASAALLGSAVCHRELLAKRLGV
jgi:alkylation response protein AidB-like acyl-CoA dehydrogenase